jgi:hypothetical protein
MIVIYDSKLHAVVVRGLVPVGLVPGFNMCGNDIMYIGGKDL